MKGVDPVREAELSFLDPVGTKIQKTVFRGLTLKRVERSLASYHSDGLGEITLYLSYADEILEY